MQGQSWPFTTSKAVVMFNQKTSLRLSSSLLNPASCRNLSDMAQLSQPEVSDKSNILSLPLECPSHALAIRPFFLLLL